MSRPPFSPGYRLRGIRRLSNHDPLNKMNDRPNKMPQEPSKPHDPLSVLQHWVQVIVLLFALAPLPVRASDDGKVISPSPHTVATAGFWGGSGDAEEDGLRNKIQQHADELCGRAARALQAGVNLPERETSN